MRRSDRRLRRNLCARPRGLPAVLRLARCVELHRLPLTETRPGRIPSVRRVPDRFAFAVGHRRECGFEAAPAAHRSLSSRESREAEISDEITCPSEAGRTLNELGWFESQCHAVGPLRDRLQFPAGAAAFDL